jgi:predicted acyltransferase
LRIPGVLQRIGICYGVAATIGLYFGWQMVFMWAVALMALYSTLMLTVPFTHKSEVRIPFVYETGQKVVGELTHANNLSRRIDEWLLIRPGRWNHAYGAYPDNEGALSTLPAIAEVLLGILAGVWLRTFRPAAERGMGLLVFGVVALLAGLALDRWLMPINKNIWTPSFTVFTVGMALLCLGTCFFFVDVLGKRGWAFPFKVYGMNAIAAFVVSGLVVRLGLFLKVHRGEQTTSVWTFYQHAVENAVVRTSDALHVAAIKAPENLSLTFAISYVLVILILMWILYLCKIFVKV